MKILKTLFGEVITIDAKDREEVKQLEAALLRERNKNFKLAEKVVQLKKSHDCVNSVLGVWIEENNELTLERDNLKELLRLRENHITVVKDLIRNVID